MKVLRCILGRHIIKLGEQLLREKESVTTLNDYLPKPEELQICQRLEDIYLLLRSLISYSCWEPGLLLTFSLTCGWVLQNIRYSASPTAKGEYKSVGSKRRLGRERRS